jgi:predicted metalloprotease with PDZ domain
MSHPRMNKPLVRLGQLLVLLFGFAASAHGAAEASADGASPEDVRMRLDAARARLDAAAQECGDLATKLAESEMNGMHRVHGHRALLGVGLGEAVDGVGVRLASVSPGGPAAAAGLKAGDVIIGLEGQKPRSSRALAAHIHALAPSTDVELDYERNGQRNRVTVRTTDDQMAIDWDPHIVFKNLDIDKTFAQLPQVREFAMVRPFGNPWRDMELATLSKSLGRYFGAERGVLVVQAPAAAKGALLDGDVITAIDGREPTDVAHTLRALSAHAAGDKVHLGLLRDHQAVQVDLTVPASAAMDAFAFAPIAPIAPAAPPAPRAPAPPKP